jgi:intermediate peptidase
LRQTPKLLDRLSDVLCLVMDMAELVRNVHPDHKWVQEADTVYEVLGRYMNGLNTHQGLYEVGHEASSPCFESEAADLCKTLASRV